VVEVSIEELRAEARNYGSKLRPRYTVEVDLGLRVKASPDEAHSAMVDEGLISLNTVPVAVADFRGSSSSSKPYYSAFLEYRGSMVEYRVDALFVGGVTAIAYRPSVSPAELRHLHPVKFGAAGVKVLSFELSNYRFTRGLNRYEELNVGVFSGGWGASTVKAHFKEAGLEVKGIPCGKDFQAFERALIKLGSPPLSPRVLAAYERRGA
jgi:hypothetical protein